MAVIMMPISFNSGRQRAIEDNRGDELAAQQRQLNETRMRGLEMNMRRDQMALDDAEQGAPLRKMKRDAEMISQIAKFGAANLERVSDEDLPEYMAQLLSDMPAYGQVQVQGGKLFDGEKSIPIDRRTAMAILQGFSDPEKAMQLKMQESPYINEQGKVETMTAGEAQQRGLGLATDQVASYGLNKARIEDRDAEENARLGLYAKRAQIAASDRAHREKPDDMQFVSPDGKTAKTMGRKQGLEMGWTPMADYKATAALQGGGDPYDFSKQNAGSVEDDAYDAYLADMGYQFSVVKDEFGNPVKQWAKGGKPAEISPDDHASARNYARLTNRILASGEAKSVPAARELAARKLAEQQSTPPVQGAQKAPDGNWYVQKDGKWFRVRQ